MKARELALRHGMRNYDAIHLAHAITAGADVLMTTDQGFPLDSAVEGVWVCAPYFWGEPSLFDDEGEN